MNLLDTIKEVGKENCLFLLNMTPVRTYFGLISIKSSGDPEFLVPCTIDESRDKLEDNYKITLKAVDEYKVFGKERFYISDLESMLRLGGIKMYVQQQF